MNTSRMKFAARNRNNTLNQSTAQGPLKSHNRTDIFRKEPDLKMELSFAYNRYLHSEFQKRLIESKTKDSRISEDKQLAHYSDILDDLKCTQRIKNAEYEYASTVKKLKEDVQIFKEITQDVKREIESASLIKTIDSILKNLKYIADNKPIEGVEPLTKPEEHQMLQKLLQGTIPILNKCKNFLDYKNMNALAEKLSDMSQMIDTLHVDNKSAHNILDNLSLAALQNASDSLGFLNEE